MAGQPVSLTVTDIRSQILAREPCTAADCPHSPWKDDDAEA